MGSVTFLSLFCNKPPIYSIQSCEMKEREKQGSRENASRTWRHSADAGWLVLKERNLSFLINLEWWSSSISPLGIAGRYKLETYFDFDVLQPTPGCIITSFLRFLCFAACVCLGKRIPSCPPFFITLPEFRFIFYFHRHLKLIWISKPRRRM